MIIAKIIKHSSSNFHGVDYNSKKVEEGIANVLQVSNFLGLDKNASAADLKLVLNNRPSKRKIKDPQFHAVISAKGKSKSFEELNEFANHYLTKLGYADNPYIIYGHNDTNNNHLHIVSSRVGEDGKKVRDNFERIRSQAIIFDYFKQEINLERKIKSLDKYKFSTLKQYQLLLEKNFSKVIENDSDFKVFYGSKSHSIDKSKIEFKLSKNNKKTPSKKLRKKQIADILKKEILKSNLKDINNSLEPKGFELAFFYRKDNGEAFGYSVIDHKTKNVFKGSEIISLNNLKKHAEHVTGKNSFINLLETIKLIKTAS